MSQFFCSAQRFILLLLSMSLLPWQSAYSQTGEEKPNTPCVKKSKELHLGLTRKASFFRRLTYKLVFAGAAPIHRLAMVDFPTALCTRSASTSEQYSELYNECQDLFSELQGGPFQYQTPDDRELPGIEFHNPQVEFKGVLLFIHGNGGNILSSTSYPLFKGFVNRGYTFLACEYGSNLYHKQAKAPEHGISELSYYLDIHACYHKANDIIKERGQG
jgi:hypothetical protein